MHTYCLTSLGELAPYAEDWDRLAGEVPFRGWRWLSAWWRNYGPDDAQRARTQLFVPCLFDDADRLVGVAPWYLDHHGPQGYTLRMLGSGEVCSDYLSVLCQPHMEYAVTQALADYLTDDGLAAGPDRPHWDLLQLDGIDAEDTAMAHLLRHLADRGCTVHRRDALSCWRLELPATWDEYLQTLSKNYRKQVRRLQRNVLDSGRAVLHSVEKSEDLPRAVDVLIDLHQRRWAALGKPGCFASQRFAAFHYEVVPQLLHAGQLQLHWLELDGRPAAAEYDLAAGGVIYAYQSGIDPDLIGEQPGRLVTLATLRRAIEHGFRAYDFLRGDEPYKARFGAAVRPNFAVRVVPDRTSAQLRHQLWQAGDNVKHWIRSSLKMARTR